MSGVRFKTNSGQIATTTVAKTIHMIKAAANHAVLIDEWAISFKGVDNSAAPVLVELMRFTTDGTMTGGTPVKDPDDTDETLQVTSYDDASAEPTAGAILMQELVHPQGGGYTWQAPFGRAIKVGGGDRVGVRVTAGASINCVVRMAGEE